MTRVIPGELLGVSEEFVSGHGTIEEDGRIFAVFAGEKQLDSSGHRLSVQALKAARPLQRGDLVYGVIQDLYEAIALVEFQALPQGSEQPASESRMAFIRVSELVQGYAENLRTYIRIGDVIRARVIEVKSLGIYLSIKDKDLGVVRAFCSRCRSELELAGREFVCSDCGSRENRKIPLN